MIDEHVLNYAADGHLERTECFGPQPARRILAVLGADPDAAIDSLAELREERELGDDKTAEQGYSLGWFDGFIIGVRAAREAARREAS